MAELTWDAVGERFYEGGVDRGVLFVDGLGVAWPGLVSVSESPTGGEPRPYYLDGYKYLNLAASEEFEATIEAFSSPREFDLCEGVNSAYGGLMITQQPRKPFGFSYRTKIGNDIDGIDHGHKIHLVYNALAAPSERTHTTLGSSAEAPTRSWSVTTLAPKIYGYRPTAHFIVDSRTTPMEVMQEVEELLYGTPFTDPVMPGVTQLLDLFNAPTVDGGDNSVVVFDTIMDGGEP